MDKPLSQETQSQIRALCESIAQRDQLGADVQEELRGHIEDKIFGYLEGREAIIEQDAVILARQHFGDALTVKTLLHSVHPQQRFISLGRRIAVVLVLTLAAQVAVRLMLSVISFAGFYIAGSGPGFFISRTLTAFGIPLLVFLVLRPLRESWSAGFIGKLATGPLRYFRVTTLIVFALWFMLPSFSVLTNTAPPKWNPAMQDAALALNYVFVICGPIALCLVWIWWCDQAPRTLTNVRAAVAAWFLFSTLSVFTSMLTPSGNFMLTTNQGFMFSPNPHPFDVARVFNLMIQSYAFIGVHVTQLLLGLITAYLYGKFRRPEVSHLHG